MSNNKKIGLLAILAILIAAIVIYSANNAANTPTVTDTTALESTTVPVDTGTIAQEGTDEVPTTEGQTDAVVDETTAVVPAEGVTTEDTTTGSTGTDSALSTDTQTAPATTTETPATTDTTAVAPTAAPEAELQTAPVVPEQTTGYKLYQHTYGVETAPVTIIEYASMSCGHCGQFHKEILPSLKTKVLDAGKAKLIFKDYPLNAPAFKAAKLTQCIGATDPTRYEGIVHALFNNQGQWAMSQDLDAALLQYGRLTGLSEEQFKTCQADTELETSLLKQVQQAQSHYKVDSTPTFVFIYNGKMKVISGVQTVEAFEKAIAEIQK